MTGVEPARARHLLLRQACLPVPSHGHRMDTRVRVELNIQRVATAADAASVALVFKQIGGVAR